MTPHSTPTSPVSHNASRLLRTTAIVLAVGMTVTVSGCGLKMFGKKDKDAFAPATLSTKFVPTANVARAWSAKVGKGEGRVGARQTPSILDGRVYTAAMTDGVHALDLATGKTLWTYKSKAELSGGPGAGDGVVVVGGLNGEVIALDAATGAQKWVSHVNNEVIATPTVGQGLALVRTNDGSVSAFDLNTGERKWLSTHTMPALTVRGNDSVTLGPGVGFVGNDDGTMSALVLESGQEVFALPVGVPEGRTDLQRLSDVDGSPVLDGTTLYATSFKNSTVAMDGPSGRPLWTSEHGGVGRAGVAPNALIVADRDGLVWALDKSSGAALWKNDSFKYRKLYSPVVQGNTVVVADFEGYLHWLSLTDGHEVARQRMGKAPIKSNPIVSNGVLVVQDIDGQVAAYRLSE